MTLLRTVSLLVIFLLMGVVSAAPIQASTQVNTYIVNTNGDGVDANPGDGICRTPSLLEYCTLQAAIEESNADGVDSVIHFSSQYKGSDDIDGCSLPALTADNTTIDASDKWDTASNRPGVEIKPAGWCDHLVIQSNGNKVRGIGFFGTGYAGVHIKSGNSNIIGGFGEHQRNVFLSVTGIKISGASRNNKISGNYIGTITGSSVPPGVTRGVEIERGDANIVEGNTIAGADEYGIMLWTNADDNTIKDNFIGTNQFRDTGLGNKIGIYVDGSNANQIGPDNWVFGNDQDGVHLKYAHFTAVEDNLFGDYLHNKGNKSNGIYSVNSDNVSISDNFIAYNVGHGLSVKYGSSLQVSGNSASDNGMDGISIVDASNAAVSSNELIGNGANGLHLNGANLVGALVINNDIGLETRAYDAGNGANGILVEGGAHSNTIGGVGTNEGNWISYNGGMGIRLEGSATHDNTVLGNVIGAPVNWAWQAPNGQHGIGIYNGAYENSIGTLFLGNYILSSGWSGIGIYKSNDNTARFNFIGTDGTGVDWGNTNYGIHIVDSPGNEFKFNEIAFNNNGVIVDGSTADSNLISNNSIHDNISVGIDLLNGGNDSLSVPVITSASCRKPLTGTACAHCLVEIFSDNDDEGQVYEGSVVADGSGNFSWSGNPNGPKITATATDSINNTSSFSLAWEITPPCNLPPAASFNYSPKNGYSCTRFEFDASASSDPEDPTLALEVRWDFDNNNIYETGWSKNKKITRVLGSPILDAPALQTVRMQVADTRGLVDTTTRLIEFKGVCADNHLPLVYR